MISPLYSVDQQGIAAHPHPDRAIGRRRQVIVAIIAQPVIARPERRGQEFAKGPAMGIPAGGAAIGRAAEAARGAEVAVEVAEAAEVAALAVKAVATRSDCGRRRNPGLLPRSSRLPSIAAILVAAVAAAIVAAIAAVAVAAIAGGAVAAAGLRLRLRRPLPHWPAAWPRSGRSKLAGRLAAPVGAWSARRGRLAAARLAGAAAAAAAAGRAARHGGLPLLAASGWAKAAQPARRPGRRQKSAIGAC